MGSMGGEGVMAQLASLRRRRKWVHIANPSLVQHPNCQYRTSQKYEPLITGTVVALGQRCGETSRALAMAGSLVSYVGEGRLPWGYDLLSVGRLTP